MWLAAIVAVALLLRAFRLGHQSLWVDEVLTFHSSDGSLLNVLTQHVRGETSIPPLYYLMVHAALRFGSNEIALRLPSVIAGSLSIVLLFLVVRPWFGRTGGLLSASVLAISPFHVWYSQEARPYALLLFLALLSLWCLQRSLSGAASRRWKVGFGLSAAAAVYTHIVGLALLGVAAGLVVYLTPRQQWRAWELVFGGIGLLILPVLYGMFVLPPDRSANPSYTFNPVHLAYAIWTFATGYSLGPSLTELHVSNRASVLLRYAAVIGPVLALFAALVGVGVMQLARRQRAALGVLILWFFVPLCLAVLGSLVTVHPFNVRYAILSLPPFLALLVAGVRGVTPGFLRAGAGVVLVVISGVSLYNYFFDAKYHREDNRAAGRFLTARALPEDIVLVNAPYTRRSLQFYYSGPDSSVLSYPRNSRYVNAASVAADLRTLLAGEPRVWLFASRTFHSDPEGHLRSYLDSHFRRELVFTGSGVQLILYRSDSLRTAPKADSPRSRPHGRVSRNPVASTARSG